MSNFRDFTATASEYIAVVDPAEVDVSGPWTAGAWLNPNSTAGTQVILRVGTEDNAPTRGLMWVFTSSVLRVRSGSNNADGTWTPSTGTWYRIGITKAGSGTGQIRNVLNGTDVGGTNSDAPTDITTGDPFQIGGTTVGGLGYSLLNAGVAWVFWLQGVTLSAAALDAYLNDPQALVDDYGPSGTVTANALKLLWPMQCDTATEEDESGVGNDGTRTGTVDLVTTGGPTPTTDWDPCAVPGPTIDTQPQNATVLLSEGSSATFTVAATGTGPLTYQWNRNDAPISGATSATLNVTGIVIGDDGDTFDCDVTDDNGTTASATATLTVLNGDALSAAGGTTDGSGEAVTQYTTDASAAAGTVSRVRAVSGSVTKTLAMRPGA